MSNVKPKVSCLCPSYQRVESLKNVVNCFNNQSYENRELVVVHRSTDIETKEYIASLDQENIKAVEVVYTENTTLGDVRNLSIDAATGDYICVWDDDDWYHRDRIKTQLEAIQSSGKQASVLFYILMYDKKHGVTYMSPRHTWEQTIMCSKQFLRDREIAYPALNRGEDKVFVSKIIEENAVVPVVNPQLYIYCYNGNNTCDAGHFEMLFGYAQKLSDAHTQVVKSVFECEYDVNYGSDLVMEASFSNSLRYLWNVAPGRH